MKRFVVAALLLLVATPALAQTGVNVSSLYELLSTFLMPLAGVIGAAIAGWLANLLRVKFNLDIEQRHREALQTAITNAVGLAISKGATLTAGKTIDVGNPAVAAALNYALAAVPDAIKYFGLTPEAVANKIAAKLGGMVSTNTSMPVA